MKEHEVKKSDIVIVILFFAAITAAGTAMSLHLSAPRTVEIGMLYPMDADASPWCLDVYINDTWHVMAFGTTDDADRYVQALQADGRYIVKAREE